MQDLLKTKQTLGRNKISPKKKVKVLNLRKRDPRVPSLEMIISSRNRLKKVENQKIINNYIVPD